ncbi:hypothetical protein HBB16_08370 [Pseudonocardia sp. MCCB 268]|nr:hypothetical protein [Pseudonocardia cytotoxica]
MTDILTYSIVAVPATPGSASRDGAGFGKGEHARDRVITTEHHDAGQGGRQAVRDAAVRARVDAVPPGDVSRPTWKTNATTVHAALDGPAGAAVTPAARYDRASHVPQSQRPSAETALVLASDTDRCCGWGRRTHHQERGGRVRGRHRGSAGPSAWGSRI